MPGIDEGAIKLEARMIAIEMLLTNLFRIVYRMTGASADDVSATHARFRATLRRETITGLDHALSDLWSAELEGAAERLLSWISQTETGGE